MAQDNSNQNDAPDESGALLPNSQTTGERRNPADKVLIGPSYQHQNKGAVELSKQKPKDEVDEASMESFPASDPPSKHHSTGA